MRASPIELTLYTIPASAVSVWAKTIENNMHLASLQLTLESFDLAYVQPLRAALRLNAAIVNLKLKLGDVSLTTRNMFPRGDRRCFRALLQMETPDLDGGDSNGQVFFVPVEDLTLERELGKGAFGSVFQGTCRNQPACIKSFHGNKQDGAALATDAAPNLSPYQDLSEDSELANQRQAMVKMQMNEFALLIEFDASLVGGEPAAGVDSSKEDVVKAMKESCVFANAFSMDVDGGMLVVMPLMAGVLEEKIIDAPLDQCMLWMAQLAQAICNLHAAGYLHRDTASRNALLDLIDGKLIAKLCDFGLSCAIESPWLPELTPLSIWPPEAVLNWTPMSYGRGGDVWAFGLMLVDTMRRGYHQGSPVDHRWLASAQDEIPSVDFTAWLLALLGRAPPPAVSLVDKNDTDDDDFVDDNASVYEEVSTEVQGGLAAWRARIELSDTILADLNPALRVLIPFLVQWCTRVDPIRRPSMAVVALLLRQAASERFDFLELPEAVVSGRLHEPHWTFGDGEFFGTVCRVRGRMLILSGQVDLCGGKCSDGGALLLGGLMNLQQVVPNS